MRADLVTSTLPRQPVRCPPDALFVESYGDRAHQRRSEPGSAAPESGLDHIIAALTPLCGTSGISVLWHAAGAGAQELGPGIQRTGTEFDQGRVRAVQAAAALAEMPPASERSQIFWDDAFVTVAIALNGGTITIAGPLDSDAQSSSSHRREMLAELLPLLVACFEQWLARQNSVCRMQSLTQAIECSGMATILLGYDAEIIHANSAAERIFADKDGLRRSGSRLACATFSDTLRLRAAIDHFDVEPSQGCSVNPVLAVPRSGRRPLTIALTGAAPAQGVIGNEVRAIAYVVDSEQDLTDIVEPVCNLHGLSPSEARLACALVAGLSLSVAAKRLGVKEQTARSYLKQVFAKTETKRQGDLVQLMLKSAIRLQTTTRTQAFL